MRMRRLTGAALAVALGSVAAPVASGAGDPAHAGTLRCPNHLVGQSATGRIHVRTAEAGQVTERAVSTPFDWTSRAWMLFGGAGAPGYSEGGYLVSTTDGVLRQVTVKHDLDADRVRVTEDRVVRTGWNPHKVTGTRSHLYTVDSAGNVRQYRVVWSDNEASLAGGQLLPVKLPDTKALTMERVVQDGYERHVIYATDGRTGALRQLVFSPGSASGARVYTLASSGYGGFTSIDADACHHTDGTPTSSLTIVGINRWTGNAARFGHSNSVGHSGATLTGMAAFGASKGWKLNSLG